LYNEKPEFDTFDLIALFKNKEFLLDINKSIFQKKLCSNLNEEIIEAVKILDMQDLKRIKEVLEKMI